MSFPQSIIGILLALALMVGCSREQGPQSAMVTPPGATNGFGIHLQEGFSQGQEVIVTIDGREVYRGTPKTKPLLGFAAAVPAASTSSHPIVTLTIPTEGIRWSLEIDLRAGKALGLSLTTNNQVRVRQQTASFGYD